MVITRKVPILQLSLCILDLIFFEVHKIEDSTSYSVIKIMFYNCCFLGVMANVICQLDISGKEEASIEELPPSNGRMGMSRRNFLNS